jgi:hypothetical protein
LIVPELVAKLLEGLVATPTLFSSRSIPLEKSEILEELNPESSSSQRFNARVEIIVERIVIVSTVMTTTVGRRIAFIIVVVLRGGYTTIGRDRLRFGCNVNHLFV